MPEEIIVDDNLIKKLLEADPNFQVKLGVVKDKIITGLNDYSSKVKNADADLFNDSDTTEIAKAKQNVLKALQSLESKLSPNGDMATKLGVGGKAGGEGVFEAEATKVSLESISAEAEKQILNIFKAIAPEKVKKGKEAKTSGTSAFVKDKLKQMGGQLLGVLGLKNLPSWLSGMAKASGAMAPVVMIAGGLIWAAIDGIQGFFKADEWGTTKTAGVIGAVLGGTGSGWENAFKNMGKWALMGAGIGLLAGPVGAIIGGLLGGAIGGILGWIGGQKIANFVKPITTWLHEKFQDILNFFSDLIQGFRDGFWEGIGYFFGRLTMKIGAFFVNMGENIKEYFAGKTVSDVFISLRDGFINFVTMIKNKVVDLWENVTGFIGNLFKGIWEKIKKGFKKGKEEEFDAMIEREAQASLQERVETTAAKTPNLQEQSYENSNQRVADEIAKSNALKEEEMARQEAERREDQKFQDQQLKALTGILNKDEGGPVTQEVPSPEGNIDFIRGIRQRHMFGE